MHRRLAVLLVAITTLSLLAGAMPALKPGSAFDAARAQVVTPDPLPPSFDNQAGVLPIFDQSSGQPIFATGDIDDANAFPETTVRVHNERGFYLDQQFWLSIRIRDQSPTVEVLEESDYAKYGLIAPDGNATYKIRFDKNDSSRIEFELDGSTDEAIALTLIQFGVDAGLQSAGVVNLGGHDAEIGQAIAEVVLDQYVSELDTFVPCANAVAAIRQGSADFNRFVADAQGCIESPLWQASIPQVLSRLEQDAWFSGLLKGAGIAVPELGLAMQGINAELFAAKVWGMYEKFNPRVPGAMLDSVSFIGYNTAPPDVPAAATTAPDLSVQVATPKPTTVTAPAAATVAPPLDLGTLGGSNSEARGINDIGQVVGKADPIDGHPHAFLWENGVMTNLEEPNCCTMSYAADINNAGQVVGTTEDYAERNAVLWENGISTDVGLAAIGGQAYGVSINNAGETVAIISTENMEMHGVIWKEGVLTDLGNLGEFGGTVGGINDAGQVVGAKVTESSNPHAFLWENDAITYLDDLGANQSSAFGINYSGQVVGTLSPASDIWHPILWTDGEVVDLGTLGGNRGSAFKINDAGQIVGVSETADGSNHGFLWEDGIMVDLDAPGGTESEAIDINNNGQIVGSITTASGAKHAVLWQIGAPFGIVQAPPRVADEVAAPTLAPTFTPNADTQAPPEPIDVTVPAEALVPTPTIGDSICLSPTPSVSNLLGNKVLNVQEIGRLMVEAIKCARSFKIEGAVSQDGSDLDGSGEIQVEPFAVRFESHDGSIRYFATDADVAFYNHGEWQLEHHNRVDNLSSAMQNLESYFTDDFMIEQAATALSSTDSDQRYAIARSQHEGSKEVIWVNSNTFLPEKYLTTSLGSGFEITFSDFGVPVDIQMPLEALAPTPTPEPAGPMTSDSAQAVAEGLLDAVLNEDFARAQQYFPPDRQPRTWGALLGYNVDNPIVLTYITGCKGVNYTVVERESEYGGVNLAEVTFVFDDFCAKAVFNMLSNTVPSNKVVINFDNSLGVWYVGQNYTWVQEVR